MQSQRAMPTFKQTLKAQPLSGLIIILLIEKKNLWSHNNQMKHIVHFRGRNLHLHTSLISMHPIKVEAPAQRTTSYNHIWRVIPLPHTLCPLYCCCVLSQGKGFPATKGSTSSIKVIKFLPKNSCTGCGRRWSRVWTQSIWEQSTG